MGFEKRNACQLCEVLLPSQSDILGNEKKKKPPLFQKFEKIKLILMDIEP